MPKLFALLRKPYVFIFHGLHSLGYVPEEALLLLQVTGLLFVKLQLLRSKLMRSVQIRHLLLLHAEQVIQLADLPLEIQIFYANSTHLFEGIALS